MKAVCHVISTGPHNSQEETIDATGYSPAPRIQHAKKTVEETCEHSDIAAHVRTQGERGQKGLLHSTAGVPMEAVSVLNTSAEMIAPAFPHAADIPCAKARYFVGKTSAG